ncbi:hypothetical protein HNP55_000252 [Paucibacter oligotrophus]|uniref:Uncharacterized protein n=1 Tax=Roseateles oligotrophus TaxID=1769250 RepID=A0A840L8Q8_9BURK|nr:hypothetical protein [Roseateles oligotrophus]MBB4841757.1 hypothetical protein [Roseateles oligotrophus]
MPQLTQYPCRRPANAKPGTGKVEPCARLQRFCCSLEQALSGLLLLAACVLGLGAAPPVSAQEAAPACAAEAASWPPLLPVAPGLWRIAAARGEPDAGNGGLTSQLFVAEDGTAQASLWLVGSGPTPAFAARLACALQARFGRLPGDVINSRATPELAMGNIAFEPARIWALPEVMALMNKRCQLCQDKLRAKLGPVAGASLLPAIIRTPTQAVQAAELGPFEWLNLDRGMGEHVLVLRHRASATVLAQGLLWAGDVPDLLKSRSDLMLAALRTLQGFAGPALLLGEQGEPGQAAGEGPGSLAGHIDYIEQLRARVWAQLSAGRALDVQDPALALPAFAALPGYALRHPLNLQQLWKELEPLLFQPKP